MNPFEFPENIRRYADEHTSDEDQVLKELFRTTHLKTVHPQMISGKLQGKFLEFITKMIRPGRILEIGTFTGYSAYCLAKGLREGGRLTTIEVNEELEDLERDFFKQAGITESIELIIGDALDIVPTIAGDFDLIFLDANKEHYPQYYHLCIEKLKIGGYLLADNVLWGGKVAEAHLNDQSSMKLHEFNELIRLDSRVENIFLTIRDGIMMVRRIK